MPSFTACSLWVPGNHYCTIWPGKPTSDLPDLWYLHCPIPAVRAEGLCQPARQPVAVAGRQIAVHMARPTHPRNRRADGRMLEDEPQRQVRQVHAFRDEGPQPFDAVERLGALWRGEVQVSPIALGPRG